MHRYRKAGLIIFITVIILSILACGGGQPAPADTQAPPPPTNTPVPPPPTDTPLPPPTNTPVPTEPEATEPSTDIGGTTERTPGQLNVYSLNSYQDEWDDWHIVGLLSNDTTRVVGDLEVEVEIFDASEASLYKEVTYPMLYNVAPGEVTPFDLWVYDDLPTADHFVATIVGQGSSDIERVNVDITNVTTTVDDYNAINLTGEVVNNSDTPVEVNGLAAALFNDAGEMVTADYENVLLHYLDPGDSGAFRISLSAPTDLIDTLTEYEFYADAVVADQADYGDFSFSDFYDYMDSYDSFHLVGTLTNNGSANISVSFVAAIYDDTGNVLDASSLSLPVYYIGPGETIPIDFDSWGPMSYTSDAYDKASEYYVTIDYYWTYESYSELVAISTQNDSNTFSNDEAKFIGYVVNDSGKDLTGATVVVALYEKGSDKVLATDYNWIFDDIANGANAAYEVTINIPEGLDPDTVEYVITVMGELP